MKEKLLNGVSKAIHKQTQKVILGWPPCLTVSSHQPERPKQSLIAKQESNCIPTKKVLQKGFHHEENH